MEKNQSTLFIQSERIDKKKNESEKLLLPMREKNSPFGWMRKLSST